MKLNKETEEKERTYSCEKIRLNKEAWKKKNCMFDISSSMNITCRENKLKK